MPWAHGGRDRAGRRTVSAACSSRRVAAMYCSRGHVVWRSQFCSRVPMAVQAAYASSTRHAAGRSSRCQGCRAGLRPPASSMCEITALNIVCKVDDAPAGRRSGLRSRWSRRWT